MSSSRTQTEISLLAQVQMKQISGLDRQANSKLKVTEQLGTGSPKEPALDPHL